MAADPNKYEYIFAIPKGSRGHRLIKISNMLTQKIRAVSKHNMFSYFTKRNISRPSFEYVNIGNVETNFVRALVLQFSLYMPIHLSLYSAC